jgi:hypothetical protein
LEEWSAVALITITETHELHSTDIPAEPEAELGCHWNLVFLGNLLPVPNLLFCLDIIHASNPPLARHTSHIIDGVRPWKLQLAKGWHAAHKAGLEALPFHSKTVAFHSIGHWIR